MQIPISPQTRAALRVLIAKGLEAVITTGSPEPVRDMRRAARRLEMHTADGRTYSGVLVVHRNKVTTGLVVEDEATETIALELPSGDNLAALDFATAPSRSRRA